MTEPAVERADAEAKLSPQVRMALTALVVGGIAAILDSTMVTLAIHRLVLKLHSSDGTIQWVTTGYLLAIAAAIPTTGWAEARWGGRRVWMAALFLFVLGSILSALSWNDTSLIGFRILQGFAAGLIIPLLQTLAVRAVGGRPSSRLDGDRQPADRSRPDLRPGDRRRDPQLAELALAVLGQRARDRRRTHARLAVLARRSPGP